MTMPNLFANETNPVMTELDENFAAIGASQYIRCTATGTNTVTMTPIASQPAVNGYTQLQGYAFVAANTNTGSMNGLVVGLGTLNFYKPSGSGPAALGAGDVRAGEYYVAIYDVALNGGSGGFHILNIGGVGAGNQSPNTVLAGPTSAANGPATFRRLVNYDLPLADRAGLLFIGTSGSGFVQNPLVVAGSLTMTTGDGTITITGAGAGGSTINSVSGTSGQVSAITVNSAVAISLPTQLTAPGYVSVSGASSLPPENGIYRHATNMLGFAAGGIKLGALDQTGRLYYDFYTAQMTVAGVNVAGDTGEFSPRLQIYYPDNGIAFYQYSSGATPTANILRLVNSRGNAPGAFGALQAGNAVMRIDAVGDDGQSLRRGGDMRFIMAENASSGLVPMFWSLTLQDAAGAYRGRIGMSHSGSMNIQGNLTINSAQVPLTSISNNWLKNNSGTITPNVQAAQLYTPAFGSSNFHAITLTSGVILGFPATGVLQDGRIQTGLIVFTESSSGNCQITLQSGYRFTAAVSLATTPNTRTALSYATLNSSHVLLTALTIAS